MIQESRPPFGTDFKIRIMNPALTDLPQPTAIPPLPSQRRRWIWFVALAAALLVVGLAVAFAVKVARDGLWAASHLRAARDCLDGYRNAEALEHLRSVLEIWPNDRETLLLAARACRRQMAFADAEAYLDRYQAAQGEDDDLTLETVLLRAERGEMDAVRVFCQNLVEQEHPGTPLILEAMANGYLRAFRLKDALYCLKIWQKRQPDKPQVYYLQGKVFDQSLNFQEGIANYRRVLELDAGNDDARLLLAAKLLDVAQAAEALPHLRYLMKRLPGNPLVPLLLARCQHQLGRLREAEKTLDRLLARSPELGLALAERGSLALQQGQNKAAERWLRRAAAREPGNYQIHFQWHQALVRTGQTEEARRVDGRMKQMERDIKRIQEIVTQKMQESPHDPELHYEVGMIALRAGAIQEGVRWLESALREAPGYRPAHEALAEYYTRIGNPGRAARHREMAQARR
jgi:tetratricopeptide (TPR) repeat protein